MQVDINENFIKITQAWYEKTVSSMAFAWDFIR